MRWYRKAKSKWGGRTLYHGTSKKSAKDIIEHGVDNSKSEKGYFGRGFYLAEEKGLAKSNYADWFDDIEDGGVVLEVQIKPNANILDLRDERDFEIYNRVSRNGSMCGRDDFDRIMLTRGIDGLFDRSFGGVVIYNPNAVVITGVSE